MALFKNKKKDQPNENSSPDSLSTLLAQLRKSNDYVQSSATNQQTDVHFSIEYFSTLVNNDIIAEDILPPLLQGNFYTLSDCLNIIPTGQVFITSNLREIEEKLLSGNVLIRIKGEEKTVALLPAPAEVGRNIDQLDIEYTVEGPKAAFVESIDQNINLIRTRIPLKELVSEELTVGTYTRTRIAILYIDGLTNIENVDTMRQRINEINIDQITDSHFIEETISGNHNSPFPQLISTENPVKVASDLIEGKVAVIVNGSPFVLLGPTTFISYFVSYEDYLNNWILSTFIRILRIFGVTFSIFATPLYVAILTYHPEIVPKDLMAPLISSRETVPFPPIMEALFLELSIELLREAGARLPTKIGQTIGIVGGIVLGTAVVEAGLTSNVLLIFVSLGALAAFTTPVYKITSTIRIIRFPFLLFAQLWGLLGMVYCFIFFLAHLIQLNSLGRPFMEPIYPFRFNDIKDSFMKVQFASRYKRPGYLQTQKPIRFQANDAKPKRDIDE
ncbi:spore germination protein [Bacillus sp. FJAT-50079]|uniref:spore germination protein n=1 Tax=Bacillus sp. FJAT-50079 TaxID=2833577 RepID=UPI001BC9B146|nr:spore germination protein [Bacillus sp. FJAT-50079]MBS4208486.1 spore germination protein [Bacillus sp. FJAT-50079]